MSLEIENMQRLIENKGFQFRDFRISGVERRDGEEGGMILRGTPIVYEQETVLWRGKYAEYREVIDPGALSGADMSDVIFNFNHGGRVYARTRNGSLTLTNTSNGLEMAATLMCNDPGHEQLYRDVSSGLLDKMSFALTVKRRETAHVEKANGVDIYLTRMLEIDRLFDVSVVTIPAYNATSISARHAFEAESELRQAESRLRANRNQINKLKLRMEAYQ